MDSQDTDFAALLSARTQQLSQALNDLEGCKALLERSHDQVLEAYGDCLEAHASQIAAHSKRVTVFSMALGRSMALRDESIRMVARAAFVHDIGKLTIPDSILCKKDELNKSELTIVREHCTRGYEMLRRVPFLEEAAEIVYSHHEHWDGSGYPRGLRETAIPLGARIIAVLNTFDHICSSQPHAPAQTYEIAAGEIGGVSGKHFDPEVVRAFLTIPSSTWQAIRDEIKAEGRASGKKL